MQTFIVINGKHAYTFNCRNITKAKIEAQNTADHSHEVIVREIKFLSNFAQAPSKFEDG